MRSPHGWSSTTCDDYVNYVTERRRGKTSRRDVVPLRRSVTSLRDGSPWTVLRDGFHDNQLKTLRAAARCMSSCPCQQSRIGAVPGIWAASRGWPNSTTSCAPGTRRRSAPRERAPRSARPFQDLGSAYTSTTRFPFPVSRFPTATPASRNVLAKTSLGPTVYGPPTSSSTIDTAMGPRMRGASPRTRCAARSAMPSAKAACAARSGSPWSARYDRSPH